MMMKDVFICMFIASRVKTDIIHFNEMIDTVERKLQGFNDDLPSKKWYIKKHFQKTELPCRSSVSILYF